MAERYLKRRKKNLSKYFFIDRRLHKILMINRPANLVEAWSFEDHKRVTFLYTDFRKKSDRAFRTADAAKILNVSKRTLQRALDSGSIRTPSKCYPLDGRESTSTSRNIYWWGLWNILEAYEYMLTVHYGRPRHDGAVLPNQNLPTRAEIIARVNNQIVLYTKEDAEYYVPLYDPPQF